MRVGELYAYLTLKSAEYTEGLAKAEFQGKSFGGKVAASLGNVAKAAAAMGLAVLAASVGIGIEATKMANAEERAEALIDAAYGRSAESVKRWAKVHAEELGVTAGELDKNLAKWGVYAKGIGLSTAQAGKFGEDMAKRAAQISAVTGDSFEDVFTKLQKGVQGATRGLKEYGVAVDPATIRNEALRLGLIKGKQQLDLHSKALATESLILKQTTPYVDAFGKAHNGAAFQTKQMGVIMDETMVAIGKAVAPIAAIVMPALAHAVQAASEWIIDNLPTIIAVFETVFGTIGKILSVAFTVIGGIISGIQTVFTNLKGSVSDNMGTISAVIAAVTGAVSAAFSFVSKSVIPVLVGAFHTLGKWVNENMPVIRDIVLQVMGAIKTVFPIVATIIGGFAVIVWKAIGPIAEVLFPILGGAAKLLLWVLDVTFKAIGGIFGVFVKIVSAAVGPVSKALGAIGNIGKSVFGVLGGVVKGAFNAIIGAIDWVIDKINGIQFHVHVGPVNIDWNGTNIPKIPFLARGGTMAAAGLAVVGENGPEVVALPGGASVYPHGTGPGGGLTVNGPLLHVENMDASNRDIDDVSRRLTRAVRLRLGYG